MPKMAIKFYEIDPRSPVQHCVPCSDMKKTCYIVQTCIRNLYKTAIMQLQLTYKSKSMMAHKFVQNDGTTIGFHGGTYIHSVKNLSSN